MKRHKYLSILLLSLTALAIGACSEDGDDDNASSSGGSSSSTFGTARVTITSNEVSAQSFGNLRPSASCTLANGDINASGECITPVSMTAKVTQLDLGHSNGSAGGRLIQFNAGPENAGYEGPQGVLGLAEYDFAESAQATNPYSDDNFNQSQTYYDTVSLYAGAIDVKLNVAADSTNPYWTIRYTFYPQNPEDDSNLSSCISSNTGLQNAVQSSGNMYSAPEGFQSRDILVCQKSTSSATCADSDFQFIDSSDGSLSTTRPSSPVQMSGTYLFDGNSSSCNQQDGGHVSLEMQPVRFQTNLASSSNVMIYKTRSAEDCLYKYTFNTTCTSSSETSGSCTSANTEAFGIDASVDFDLTESVFVPNSIDLDSTATATILQNLHQVLPRPIYFENNKSAVGTGYTSGISTTVSITANNDLATAALVSRSEDPNNYDSEFCFIAGSD